MMALGKPCGAVTPRCHPPLWLSEGCKRDSRVTPLPSAVPDLPALLHRAGASVTMYISKREPTIEELLADPVMLIMLRHSRTTAEDLRGLVRNARERLAKAKAEDSEQPGREEIGGGAPMGPRSNGVRRRLHIASVTTGKPCGSVTPPSSSHPPCGSREANRASRDSPVLQLSLASRPCCFGWE
jgi:hypothetical protein